MAVCTNCKLDNENYARFCVDCGGALAAQKISPCLSCGKTEVLNGQFCIACGAEQVRRPTKVQRFTWTSETAGRETQRLMAVVEKQEEMRLLRTSILLGLAGGIAFGCLVFSFLKSLQNLETLPLFGKIPSQGLIIYSKQPNASVVLKRVSDSPVESLFYLGEADSGGTFKMSSLAPGDYVATLGAPGKLSSLQSISLSDRAPTVVGYPEKIELP